MVSDLGLHCFPMTLYGFPGKNGCSVYENTFMFFFSIIFTKVDISVDFLPASMVDASLSREVNSQRKEFAPREANFPDVALLRWSTFRVES